jgi:hypothetical protein
MAEFLLVGTLLGLVQLAAAMPWVAVLDPVGFKTWSRSLVRSSQEAFMQEGVLLIGTALKKMLMSVRRLLILIGGTILGLVVLLTLIYISSLSPDQMALFGRLYAAVLQLQLSADFFVLFFLGLLKVWPQGAAVGLAAFREGIRQPLFWLITVAGLGVLLITPFLPYFTFGEDFKMVKEIGYDLIMLSACAFGVVAASMSISEELEGKTAITLMSKPISRRQFLLGKYVGILMAALGMTLLLGWVFLWMLLFKQTWDPLQISSSQDKVPDPEWVTAALSSLSANPNLHDLLRGVGLWTHDFSQISLGLLLGFGQLMVLLAIAVALATRLPMVVNLVICAAIFFLGHLTPVLTAVSRDRLALVHFTAQLFDTLLPGLEFFDMGPATVREVPIPQGDFAVYVGSVTLYSVVYTAIALLFGLILFEDRDVA